MSTDAGTPRAMIPRRLATSATVPRERGDGSLLAGSGGNAAAQVARKQFRVFQRQPQLGGRQSPVARRRLCGSQLFSVALRARGITLGGAGFASTGRGRVRGGRIETWGRVSCLASAGTGFGVVVGAGFSCPASAGTGAGVVAGAAGSGAICASAGPQADNRQVATIVELSHRDRRTPSGTG